MYRETEFDYFEGNSFSDIFRKDVADSGHALLLSYPCTAQWSRYPNTETYLIQDGSSETTKVGFDKIFQKEPWKNLAILGDDLPGILMDEPPSALVSYWREHFGFNYDNRIVLPPESYCEDINSDPYVQNLITLFPFDHIASEKHAVNPVDHYDLLSKTRLADMGVHYPYYKVFDFREVGPEDVELQAAYPYLIKTSHGLAGEGTYIIRNEKSLDFCRKEVRTYLRAGQVNAVVVSDFVKNEVQNYCVQFYVDRDGHPTLLGATNQLVTAAGAHLGGLIHYRETDMSKFYHKIAVISRFVHKHGYFGVVGVDILEDADGQLHLIDANIRINGSTPLCLLRHTLLAMGREVAKYCTDYRMEGTLDEVLASLRPELDRKDLIVFSALEVQDDRPTRCEIYGVVTGENLEQLQHIEAQLSRKGLWIET